MGRARDISKVFSTGTALATDSEVSGSYLTQSSASTVYQTKSATGLTLISPSTIANTSGTASIGTNGTVTFSGVSNISLNNVFSSTYKNYKIILNITSVTSDCSIFIKMRSGATDSSASYTSNRLQVINGTVSGAYGSPETNGFFIFNPDTAVGSGYYNASIDLSNPFESLTTTAQVFSVGLVNAGSYFLNLGGTLHELSNSYDSLNVLTNAGNMTGSIRVYGYNQ